MIFNLFAKTGRFMCRIGSNEKLSADGDALAAVVAAMLLLALMACGTVLMLARLARICQIEALVMVLAVGVPWVVFDFCIKPSSQWLSPYRVKK